MTERQQYKADFLEVISEIKTPMADAGWQYRTDDIVQLMQVNEPRLAVEILIENLFDIEAPLSPKSHDTLRALIEETKYSFDGNESLEDRADRSVKYIEMLSVLVARKVL